ncbi:MAG TPA: phytase [Arenimonas sp.]|uniref:phytase n=1 Tax=Arenimonas sp. TaxID=1872635 RepID=UPI002D7FA30F|nr:phytase [Arenimonas sp.]HEU0152083.1 phytase [Arenimonas sp.]
MRPALLPLALLPLLIAAACSAPTPDAVPTTDAVRDREPDENGEVDPLLAGSGIAHAVVPEAFLSAMVPADNIDSPAAWTAPDGSTWVIATAKEGDKGLVVYDGDTGATLRSVGTVGPALGQFNRPNGVAVVGDLLFVVERDNARVQVLSLPGFEPRLGFGQDALQKPYGLWVRAHAPDDLEVLVSDAYMAGQDAGDEDILPPMAELDHRIHRYRVRGDAAALTAEPTGPFGATSVLGAIRIPESLWGDVANDRLLIAEEDVATGTGYREYALDGQFKGRSIGVGRFKAQAEGVTLWACDDGSGYWIATDQFKDHSLFHVFDRVTLDPLGAFAGNTIANTDGVWLHQAGTRRFPAGVFYAVHDDMGIGAFDWRDIAAALGLQEQCTAP